MRRDLRLPNGLELSCPAEAGNSPLLYARLAGDSSIPESAARRVSFSELLGAARVIGRSLWALASCYSPDNPCDQRERCEDGN